MEGTQLENIAGWVAPAATMIAAMMTAMNLGARVTGWGFVVFTLGSICWTIVGLTSGQTNLIAANVFLTLVNLLGIWRWLGRQSAYEDGAKAATDASRAAPTPQPVHRHRDRGDARRRRDRDIDRQDRRGADRLRNR
jgi:hypothetical protein